MSEFFFFFLIGFAVWFFGLGWVVIKHIHDDDEDYE